MTRRWRGIEREKERKKDLREKRMTWELSGKRMTSSSMRILRGLRRCRRLLWWEMSV